MLHPEAGGPPHHLQVSGTGGVLLLCLSALLPQGLYALSGSGTISWLNCSLQSVMYIGKHSITIVYL